MGENCDEKFYEGKGGKALFEKEKSQQKITNDENIQRQN